MKTKIIIASYRRSVEDIIDSPKMIAGEQDHVEPFCTYVDRSVDYGVRIRQLAVDHDYEKQTLLVIINLLRGSVNSEFMRFTEDCPFYLVSELNLSPLLESVLYPNGLRSDTIQKIVEHNSDYMVFCNGDILRLQEENDFQEDEHVIKILHVDHGLLHGRIAFSWTGYLGVSYILTANNDCVTNDLRRTMFRLARPSSCKLIVKGTEGSIAILNSGKASKHSLLTVVDNVADVYRPVSGVDRIHIADIGGLEVREHTYPRPSNRNINFTDEKEMMLRELVDKNISVEPRIVPSDPVKRS